MKQNKDDVNCGNTNSVQIAGYDELSMGFEPIRNGSIF